MEKEDIEKILKELNASIIDNFIITTVRELYKKHRYTKTNLPFDCYNLSLENIISFYKINLLLENNIIDEETKYKLDDLYLEYLEVKGQLENEIVKEREDDEYFSKDLQDLYQRSRKIEEILNEYYILQSMNYSEMFKQTFLSMFNINDEKGIPRVKE